MAIASPDRGVVNRSDSFSSFRFKKDKTKKKDAGCSNNARGKRKEKRIKLMALRASLVLTAEAILSI